MRRRGRIAAWDNRYWRNSNISDYSNSQWNTDLPSDQAGGGTIDLNDFMIVRRGLGYNPTTNKLIEVAFVSTALTSDDGVVYRFCQLMRANTVYEYDEDGNIEDEYITSIETHVGIIICNLNGTLSQSVSGRSSWDGEIGTSGNAYTMYDVYYSRSVENLDSSWNAYTTMTPVLDASIKNDIQGPGAATLHRQALAQTITNTGAYQCVRPRWGTVNFLDRPALFWNYSNSTSNIVTRAMSLSNYKYWYGGKGQIANLELANSLRNGLYTRKVWTQAYYNEAILDIDGTTRVGDCSFLVCYAYDVRMIGSTQIVQQYRVWNGVPQDGMILWRPGHVAIYGSGNAIQLKGLRYDFQVIPIENDRYQRVLYDPTLSY